jgi:hypothetical protein
VYSYTQKQRAGDIPRPSFLLLTSSALSFLALSLQPSCFYYFFFPNFLRAAPASPTRPVPKSSTNNQTRKAYLHDQLTSLNSFFLLDKKV